MTITQDSVSLTSVYVTARDKTRLVVDIWMPADTPAGTKLPTIFHFTRYWRSGSFKEDNLAWQMFYEDAALITTQGFAYVNADARGSGASFGTRELKFVTRCYKTLQ